MDSVGLKSCDDQAAIRGKAQCNNAIVLLSHSEARDLNCSATRVGFGLKARVSPPYNAISMNSNSPVMPRIVLSMVFLMAIAIPVGITLQDTGKLALMEKTAE